MDAHSRLRVEMGTRALEFSRANPDSEPGTAEVVARLEQLILRANGTAAAQRDGIIQVHAARARKDELRRAMLVSITHLAEWDERPRGRSTSWGRRSGSDRMRRPISRSGPRRGGWRQPRRSIGRPW